MLKPRLTAVIGDVKKRGGSFIPALSPMWRDVALSLSMTPERSLVQLRAGIVCELAGIVPLQIGPDWTLAGEHLIPDSGATFGMNRLNDDPARLAALDAIGRAGEFESIKSAVLRYHSHCSATAPGESEPDLQRGAGGWGTVGTDEVFMAAGWKENHSIRDWSKLLRLGFAGIREEILAALHTCPLTAPDYPERENFLRAGLLICDAGITLGRRHAELAEQMAARAKTDAERLRLGDIAANCRRVPAHGATTFREAVQALWFGHILSCAEDGINANSIGRLDQILYPYYRRDLDRGLISREEAVELMIELAAKLYLTYDVQAITLGGVDAAGQSAVNDLSYVILDVTEAFGEIRDLSVRIDSHTPEDFLRACARLVIRGGGIPFFFNDEAFIPALNERGIPLADTRDYAPIGCVELTIPGKANPRAVSGWFNLAKCLELTIFNGIDPASRRQLGPATGDVREFRSYEEFENALFRQIVFFGERMIYHCRRGELAQREFGPLPCWSVLTDDCISRGRDITNGGALYNYHSICLMGVPDTADALTAIRQLIFEKATVSFADLLPALRTDFQGFEKLRQQLLREAPKYGNGNPECDLTAARLCDRFIDLTDSWSTPENRFFVHLFTFKLNIDFGRKVGALPDGRHAGEPLAYSLSPHQGRDLKRPDRSVP